MKYALILFSISSLYSMEEYKSVREFWETNLPQTQSQRTKNDTNRWKDLPPTLQKLCKKAQEANDTHHCNQLAKFFYCAQQMNCAKRTEGLIAYCDIVYGYDRESRISGLPSDWDLSYHIKNLAEEFGQSPSEVRNTIEEARAFLLQLRRKELSKEKSSVEN